MPLWVRFSHAGQTGFGTLDGEAITVHAGDMFAAPMATGHTIPLAEAKLLTPSVPSKMFALWNNFHALATKLELATPSTPLYLLKANNSFLGTGETINRPRSYAGPVVYEGELGIVIGKTCKDVAEENADDAIFGYTCINDVTAAKILKEDPSFDQWSRAKSFDGFGVFGPAIATGLKPEVLSVRTVLNGMERQSYPIADMIFPPRRLVSLISRDMTLVPGDVICCGTSVGVGSMKEPRNIVEVTIEGIGTLRNEFVN